MLAPAPLSSEPTSFVVTVLSLAELSLVPDDPQAASAKLTAKTVVMGVVLDMAALLRAAERLPLSDVPIRWSCRPTRHCRDRPRPAPWCDGRPCPCALGGRRSCRISAARSRYSAHYGARRPARSPRNRPRPGWLCRRSP